ncbi:MAG: hypothetical protein AB3N28_03530 [Kordiimonas sp.]
MWIRKIDKLRTTTSAVALVLVAEGTALGQSSPVENPPLEENVEQPLETIVVTGSKRDTTLIDSDLAVTVLDSKTIADARIRDFKRIDDLVPNVKFNESGQRGSIYITVRGVESNPFIIN